MKKMKCLSLFLVLAFILQSIVSPVLALAASENVVMEISVPQLSLTNSANTANSVELVWTSNDNSIKPEAYDIYRDDSFIKTTESFAYTDTELTPETEYKYMVKAKDADGIIIAESNTLAVTTLSKAALTSTVPANLTGSSITPEQTAENENMQLGNQFEKGNPNLEADRFIIKYKNGNSKISFRKALKKMDKLDKYKLNELKINQNKDFELISLNKKEKFKDFVTDLKKNDINNDIEYIQPDYQLSLASNDSYYSSQWGLENKVNEVKNYSNIPILEMFPPHLRDAIDRNREFKEFLMNTPAEEVRYRLMAGDVPGNVEPHILMELDHEPAIKNIGAMTAGASSSDIYLCDAGVTGAWDKSMGDGVTIAVIDTGIDIAHEDLAENIWTNSKEIPDNGIDDDGNGKIDDINGWNFSDDSNIVCDNTNIADENHGTHIAGIIAAVKDNTKGISGVAPLAKIMPLKVFKNGKAYTSDIISAIQYAENMGVRIINCSWGSIDDNPALKDVIQNSNMLFVCAAGNNSANIDSNPLYPAAFDCSNIITVASVNRNGILSGFSNYGENGVHVAAPGEGIKSTLTGNSYGENSGTSMAAAFVSGEAALVLGGTSTMGAIELKDQIVRCSEHLSSMVGKVNGSAKINCFNAVNNIMSNEITNVPDAAGTQISDTMTENSKNLGLFSAQPVQGQFIKIVGGDSYSLALKNDGTVWACGRNDKGQLGDGTKTDKATVVQVSGLSGITAIAGGYSHSLTLKNDGTVWAWGDNYYGQLGDGTRTDKTTAVQVSGLSGITAIAGGGSHSLALKDDGTVWAWGRNDYGQLGDGTNTYKTTAVQVSGLSGIAAIAGGYSHGLALKNDGTVWAWGDNHYGQLGDGTKTNKTTAVQVSGLSGVAAIAGGYSHSLALKNDGTVWAWGDNYYGQLGDGTITYKTTAVQVSGLGEIKAIASGNNNSLALKNDGTMWAWGSNYYGQLGDGTRTDKTTAVQVSGLSGITAIAGGYSHSLALKNDGTVWAWGDNYYGQLGDGIQPYVPYISTAVQVNGLSGITAIARGYSHSLALKNDGTVWAWGSNVYGQLGDGTVVDRATAVQVSRLSGITAIAGGYLHSLALKNDGTVWAWGSNVYGQLGDGTVVDKATAVQVSGLSGITAIASGYSHSLALREDGTVWAWGNNDNGQLGDGTTMYATTAVQVSGLSRITAIAGGGLHSLALKNDGTVWAWGNNLRRQLGEGIPAYVSQYEMAVQVSGLNYITAIASGYSHSLAQLYYGDVQAWGNNEYGQLGDGTTTDMKEVAVNVSGLEYTTAIAGAEAHSLALKNDGTVWAWGNNGSGQLGDGTITDKTTAVQVSGLGYITAIAGGGYNSLALKNDGTVWVWGSNSYGQLGNGNKRYSEYAKYSFGTPKFNELTTTYTASCTSGSSINIILSLSNIKSFKGRSFTVLYNTSEISAVKDLCRMTYKTELATGDIAGTGITIVQNDPGIIKFTVDKVIPEGKSWSGIVNIIVLKAKVSGQVTLTYEVK